MPEHERENASGLGEAPSACVLMGASARMRAGLLLLLLSGRAAGAGWEVATSGEVSIDEDVAASEPLRVGPCWIRQLS